MRNLNERYIFKASSHQRNAPSFGVACFLNQTCFFDNYILDFDIERTSLGILCGKHNNVRKRQYDNDRKIDTMS